MSRPAEAVIDLDALRHNFYVIRKLTRARITSVIKCNAYGLGALRIARELENTGTDAFAVSSIEEAIEQRNFGVRCPIILLEGCFEASEMPLVEKHHLTTLLHCKEQVDMFLAYKPKTPLDVWIKIDTGMHRLGFSPEVFLKEYQRIINCPHIGHIVLATHFSCADEPDNPYTQKQIKQFKETINGLNHPVSMSNSAAVLQQAVPFDNWVRPGVLLGGISPLPQSHQSHQLLKPVMTLKARIIVVKEVAANEAIGYGNTYIATEPKRIGIVAYGYGDGYPHQASAGAPVMVKNTRSMLLGKVSMDMLAIDLTHIPDAGVGADVILWGAEPSVTEIAKYAKTVPYALLTGVKRVKRTYIANFS